MEVKPRTQSERRATTRRNLLDATIEMLMSDGLGACSLAAVASKADMTTGALQHHFRNKLDLIRAVISERLFSEDKALDLSGLNGMPLEARCKLLVEHQWGYYGNPKYIAIWDVILGARKNEYIQEEIRNWQRSGTKRLEAAIAMVFSDQSLKKSDIQAIQYFLNAHLRGLALLRTVQDEPKIVKEQLAMLRTLLTEYIQDR